MSANQNVGERKAGRLKLTEDLLTPKDKDFLIPETEKPETHPGGQLKGAAKGKPVSMVEALKRYLRLHPDDKYAIVARLCKLAMGGNPFAISEVFNRIDGKAIEHRSLSTELPITLIFVPVGQLSNSPTSSCSQNLGTIKVEQVVQHPPDTIDGDVKLLSETN